MQQKNMLLKQQENIFNDIKSLSDKLNNKLDQIKSLMINSEN